MINAGWYKIILNFVPLATRLVLLGVILRIFGHL